MPFDNPIMDPFMVAKKVDSNVQSSQANSFKPLSLQINPS
jgi:hypothetical protein